MKIHLPKIVIYIVFIKCLSFLFGLVPLKMTSVLCGVSRIIVAVETPPPQKQYQLPKVCGVEIRHEVLSHNFLFPFCQW